MNLLSAVYTNLMLKADTDGGVETMNNSDGQLYNLLSKTVMAKWPCLSVQACTRLYVPSCSNFDVEMMTLLSVPSGPYLG